MVSLFIHDQQPQCVVHCGVTMTYNGVDLVAQMRKAVAPMDAAMQRRHLAVLKEGSPYVAIIECDSDQEARDLSDLACSPVVGGEQ